MAAKSVFQVVDDVLAKRGVVAGGATVATGTAQAEELNYTVRGKQITIPLNKEPEAPVERTTVPIQEHRDRNLIEKLLFPGEIIKGMGIEILTGDTTAKKVIEDKGFADAAAAGYEIWNNPDHKVKTSFMEAQNDAFDKIYADEQKYGAHYLSDSAKWKSKYESELAGYKLVGKEMPKEERELFEKHIKYSSDFSFMNWLARPENAHMRAAYVVGAGLSADLFLEPLVFIGRGIALGYGALKGTAKVADKAVTGGKGAKKVSKFKEAREIKKIKKASDNAAKLAATLEKKVEKFVLVDKMDPFKAAQKAWNSTSGKNQIILANYKHLHSAEDIQKSLTAIEGKVGLEAIAKASTAAEIAMPKHLIPTKMKKMFDAYKNTTAHKLTTKPLGQLGSAMGKEIDKFAGLALTRIEKFSPYIASKLKKFEFKLAVNFNKDIQAIGPWLIQYSKLAKPQQRALDKALYSGNFKEARLIMSKTKGMVDEFDNNVIRILEGKRKQLQGVSKKTIGVSNYFPRNVTDTKGLKAWEVDKLKAVKGEGTPAGEFDPDDIVAILNRNISKDLQLSERTLSAEKRRIIKEIDDTNIGFYNSSDNSIVNYLREVNHQVELRKFLGKSGKYLDEGDSHLDDSIGQFIKDEAKLGKLDSADIDDLEEILKSRFIAGEKGLGKKVRAVKNIGYLTTIANPYSALIQFGDIGASMYTNGIIKTVVSAAKIVKGGKKISYDETFGQKLMAEMAHTNPQGKLKFKNIRSSGDVLDIAMSLSQFRRVDMFGKDVVLNSALNKWGNIGKNKALQAEFRIKYNNSFTKEEMDNLISDFSNLKIYPNSAPLTDDIKFVLFNELMDVQPITMSQMPTAYLNATKTAGGMGRLMYQLKTFTLKQMDIVRTRGLQKIANGRVVEGTQELLKYSLILGGTNATAQTIKRQIQDWIEGGDRMDRWLDENPTAVAMISNNVLKLWGVGEREKNYLTSTAVKKLWQDQLTPVPVSKLNDAFRVFQGNKEFYDFAMNTIPKPIANPSFFTAYAFNYFFNARTSNDLKNSNKRTRQRNNRTRNRPTRQRAR